MVTTAVKHKIHRFPTFDVLMRHFPKCIRNRMSVKSRSFETADAKNIGNAIYDVLCSGTARRRVSTSLALLRMICWNILLFRSRRIAFRFDRALRGRLWFTGNIACFRMIFRNSFRQKKGDSEVGEWLWVWARYANVLSCILRVAFILIAAQKTLKIK